MRYHVYVNNDGELLCVQVEYRDGYKGEPWRPFNKWTLVHFAEVCCQDDDRYGDSHISIHTQRDYRYTEG